MIPPDVLDKFEEMYHRFIDKTLNPNKNIQCVEITSMEEHFNTLNNSDLTFDTTFLQ